MATKKPKPVLPGFKKALGRGIKDAGSVAAYARKIGVSRETVSAWKNGRRYPSALTMQAVIDDIKRRNL